MLKIGKGRPNIQFQPASNDMGHFFPSEYTMNDWFYMSLDEYMNKTEFENFNMKDPPLTKFEIDDMMRRATGADSDTNYPRIVSFWETDLQRLIKKAGGLLWQYNVYNKELDGWLRYTSCLGEKSLKRWSWFDCYVKFPILDRWCRLLNKTLYFKRKKEWAEWDKFLDTMHKGSANG